MTVVSVIATCLHCRCAFIPERDGTCNCQDPWPPLFWRWRCPAGHGGAYNTQDERDAAADRHELECPSRPVAMQTAATPDAWVGQTTLGA